MAMILVTHDLGVVAGRTDEIAVMYAGKIVEKAPTSVLFSNMKMPYTEALVRRFEQGTVRLHFIDTVEPSVLAHEILNGAPFTYLDEDTEIGERRSRAVPLRRGLLFGASRRAGARPLADRTG